MHAQNLIIDQCSDGQAVEAICKNFPELDAMASFALIVETINTIDAGTLVIAA